MAKIKRDKNGKIKLSADGEKLFTYYTGVTSPEDSYSMFSTWLYSHDFMGVLDYCGYDTHKLMKSDAEALARPIMDELDAWGKEWYTDSTAIVAQMKKDFWS